MLKKNQTHIYFWKESSHDHHHLVGWFDRPNFHVQSVVWLHSCTSTVHLGSHSVAVITNHIPDLQRHISEHNLNVFTQAYQWTQPECIYTGISVNTTWMYLHRHISEHNLNVFTQAYQWTQPECIYTGISVNTTWMYLHRHISEHNLNVFTQAYQ